MQKLIYSTNSKERLGGAEKLDVTPQIGWRVIDNGAEFVVTSITLDAVFNVIRVDVEKIQDLDPYYVAMSKVVFI